jgi:membrane-associated phospholipid phosphatase
MIIKIININLDTISDHISLLPLIFYYGLFFNYLGTLDDLDFKFYISYLFVTLIGEFIKMLPCPKPLYQITRRPAEACNCDILSKGGKVVVGTPGFPSGHMMTVTFFCLFIMTRYNLSIYQKQLLYLLMPLTAWARIHKRCHNIFQILGGFSFGFLINKYLPI